MSFQDLHKPWLLLFDDTGINKIQQTYLS